MKPIQLPRTAGALAGILTCTVLLGSHSQAWSQGCVAARGCGMMPGTYGLNLGQPLPPSSGFQANVGYRWLHSDRHFVGDVEQVRREEEGSRVINDSHFIDVGVTYSFNPRFSASLTVPFSIHDRSQTYQLNGVRTRYHTSANGIGDVRLEGNMWILDPHKHTKGNVLVGLGFSAPSGEKDARDIFPRVVSGQLLASERTVDQSIQPGTGGWGIVLDFYAYREIVPRLNGYVNGSYTFTPEEKNGVPTFRSNPFEAEMSIADNYMGRLGVEYLIWPKHGLTFSLGPRIEGVPVRDAFGGSEGFRRPGYAVSVEPGVSVTLESWTLSLYAPVAVYRNRERSVPDLQQSVATGTDRHGDAAFADFLIMFNLAKRF